MRSSEAVVLYETVDDVPGPMDTALAHAFEEGAHTRGDMLALREELAGARLPRIPSTELVEFATAWLDAAAYLRAAQLPVTLATLAGIVAAGHTTFASVHARQLLALAGEPANESQRLTPAPPVKYRGNRRCAYCGVRDENGMCDRCGRHHFG